MDDMKLFWIGFFLLILFIGVMLRIYYVMQERKEKKRYRSYQKKRKKRRNISIGKISDYIVERKRICDMCGKESDNPICDDCRESAEYRIEDWRG